MVTAASTADVEAAAADADAAGNDGDAAVAPVMLLLRVACDRARQDTGTSINSHERRETSDDKYIPNWSYLACSS